MEAENYLANGFGVRLALEAQAAGWARLSTLARVWQPSRLKGIQVSPSYGTPFLGATQVLDLRPVPRKWLALDRTDDATERFVQSGMILVTCSGSVGRATLAHRPHEDLLVSHDLLRVDPLQHEWWGWIYAYLRSPRVRAMMNAAQYGHIIKHLETSHLDALPVPRVRDHWRSHFQTEAQQVLDRRNAAFEASQGAEAAFQEAVGSPGELNFGERGFSVTASNAFTTGRRRLEAWVHTPAVHGLRAHLAANGRKVMRLADTNMEAWLPNRFKRVPARQGVTYIDSSDLFEINPDMDRVIADGDFGDVHQGRVKPGWLLMARSGQIYGINGQAVIAGAQHENKVVSDDVIRIAPKENADIRAGYVYVALTHPELGRPLVKALAYGSSIPHIDPTDVASLPIVRLSAVTESRIADLAEKGARLQAEADILETKLSREADELIGRFLLHDMTEFET